METLPPDLFRGISIGALASVLIGLARSPAERSLKIASSLFWLSAICFIIVEMPNAEARLGWAIYPLWLLNVGAAGYLWAFFVGLFEDLPVKPWRYLPALGLTALGLLGYLLPRPLGSGFWIAHYALQFALMGHLLFVIHRSTRGDLVEARRRLRGPIAVITALYMVAITSLNLGFTLGYDFAPLLHGMRVALAGVSLVAAGGLLEARNILFGAARPALAMRAAPADTDIAMLARLEQVMGEGQLWRQEGLTIGQLADAAGIPEHRLRRLINDSLGHRNFPAYVNERRIEAARRALADPANARQTVAAIAYDIGFGSLGPFNRAFREATGQSPTEYRRLSASRLEPIPEMSR